MAVAPRGSRSLADEPAIPSHVGKRAPACSVRDVVAVAGKACGAQMPATEALHDVVDDSPREVPRVAARGCGGSAVAPAPAGSCRSCRRSPLGLHGLPRGGKCGEDDQRKRHHAGSPVGDSPPSAASSPSGAGAAPRGSMTPGGII